MGRDERCFGVPLDNGIALRDQILPRRYQGVFVILSGLFRFISSTLNAVAPARSIASK